jgi:hypothetical protein
MTMTYEVVVTHRHYGEMLLATHTTLHAAHRDYRDGRSRCWQLIHGGTLRIDKVITV